jgi:hypothetical protein
MCVPKDALQGPCQRVLQALTGAVYGGVATFCICCITECHSVLLPLGRQALLQTANRLSC